MTRSSINELFTPYKEPEQEFRSSRRHFKTLSLDELRSPDFNLLSDQEYSEEEEGDSKMDNDWIEADIYWIRGDDEVELTDEEFLIIDEVL
ncbi:hypothetical protein Tco_0956968 [Tanacetum coccineum]